MSHQTPDGPMIAKGIETMTSHQGSTQLLDEPLAQELLQSKLPAYLAYNCHDNSPRLIPIGFHWNDREIVLCSPPDAPKMRVLQDGIKVALTITSERTPMQVLSIRGSVRVELVEGMPPEYVAMTERTSGKEHAGTWLTQAGRMWPVMVRIFVQPEWVGLIDFETRFPSAVEHGQARIEQAQVT